MSMRDPIIGLLQACPEFRAASQAEIEALAGQGRLVRYRAGEPVWAQGDPVSAVYVPSDGLIQISIQNPDGDRVTTALQSGRHLIGEGELFAGLPRRFNEARALSAFEAAELPAAAFRQCVNGSAPLLRYWLQGSNLRFMRAVRQVEIVSQRTPEKRLHSLLAHFLNVTPVEADGTVILPFSQEAIGNMASLSRQVTSQVMTGWRSAGHVDTRYQRLVILNRQHFADEAVDARLLESLKDFL